MILDDMKNLIKDFEKTLIKDTRFKKDYKFKNQVKTLYKNHKMVQQSQIIVPVPYYSGSLKTEVGAETKSDAQSTSNKKCPPEKTCPPEKNALQKNHALQRNHVLYMKKDIFNLLIKKKMN